MSDDRRKLTVEEALSCLPDGEEVHTFLNPGGMMLGADWERASVESVIRQYDGADMTGGLARGMGHGMAVIDNGRRVFISTDEDRLAAVGARQNAAA